LELYGFLGDSSQLKASLTAAVTITGGIEIEVDNVEFDGQLVDLIIEVLVALDLSADRPVPHVSSSVVKKLELIRGSDEQVLEPCWYWW
jgi:hypothetical protein